MQLVSLCLILFPGLPDNSTKHQNTLSYLGLLVTCILNVMAADFVMMFILQHLFHILVWSMCFRDGFFLFLFFVIRPITYNNVEIWRRNVESADLARCCLWRLVLHVTRVIKMPIIGNCIQNQCYLTSFNHLLACSDTENGSQLELWNIKSVFNFNLKYHLTEFVSSLSLYLDVDNFF